MSLSNDSDGVFVLLSPRAAEPDVNSNASNESQDKQYNQRQECGCPGYKSHISDIESVVASVSLSHEVVQDPNHVLAQLPKHHKTCEERLFLLDAWSRRPALYYTDELIHAFIDAFAPIRLAAGMKLIRERDVIKQCHLVYKGQLRELRGHPSPCLQQYQLRLLESGAELFFDSLCIGKPCQFTLEAVEDTLLFSLGLKDLVSLRAAANEIQRGAFLECLRGIKYLRPLPVKDMHALAESWDEPLKTYDYEAGYVLLNEGSVPDRLYCILQGSVNLSDSRGASTRRGAGENLCCQALLRLASPYTATVTELSTLISLQVDLCPQHIYAQLADDAEALARVTEELQSELVHNQEEEVLAAATAADAEPAAEPATVADAVQDRQRLSFPALHRRSVLRLCRTPQLSGLLRPTELDSLFGDKVQMVTQILTLQKHDCLYAEGTDYAKKVYVLLEGELRETAPVGPDGSHILLGIVSRGGCACLESLLLQSACLCSRSAYANKSCTVVALDVDSMEEALCRSFISVMKRRSETFRQFVGATLLNAADDDRAFRDEVFPPSREDLLTGGHVSGSGQPAGRDELTFKGLAVIRLVTAQIQQLLMPLGNDILTPTELRSLRFCHRAVILGGRGLERFAVGETMVTEEASKRRIIYFLQSGEAEVSHTARCGAGSDSICQERTEIRPAGSLLCPEQLYLPSVCCYEARALQDDTELQLVNQHVLETAIGCEFRDIFLRRPEAFKNFLATRYPAATETELQLLIAPATTEATPAAACRVYAFGLEALICHPQVGRLFTERELQRLKANQASVMAFVDKKTPNQSIFLEGTDQMSCLFIVYSGRVSITVTPGPNRPSQLLETLEAGELFGTESLLRHGFRSTSAYAASDTELIIVPVEKLEAATGASVEELLARDGEAVLGLFRGIFQLGHPLPRDGWRSGVDLQQLQQLLTAMPAADTGGRPRRGRHLRVEAELLREAENTRLSDEQEA